MAANSSDDSPLFLRSGVRVLAERPPVVIDISYDALLAKVGVERPRRTHLTKFEVDGSKEERIIAALQRSCCKKGCLKKIDPDRARSLCTMWHTYLAASERKSFIHHCLHAHLNADRDSDTKLPYCKYRLAGARVVGNRDDLQANLHLGPPLPLNRYPGMPQCCRDVDRDAPTHD